jgi:hypothetical protein
VCKGCGQRCVVSVDGVGIFLTSHVCVVTVDVVCSKFCVVNAMWLRCTVDIDEVCSSEMCSNELCSNEVCVGINQSDASSS